MKQPAIKNDLGNGLATISVVLPEVVIKIEDLAALRALWNAEQDPKKPRCGSASERSITRLIITGLAEHVMVPPAPEEISEFEKKVAQVTQQVRAASGRKIDFVALNKINLYTVMPNNQPKPQQVLKVTAAGVKLLKTGNTRSTANSGCA